MKETMPIKQIFRTEWENNYRQESPNPSAFLDFFSDKKKQGVDVHRSGDTLFIEENPQKKPSGPFHIVSANTGDKYLEDFKRFLLLLGANKKMDSATVFFGNADLFSGAPDFLQNSIEISENTDQKQIEPFVMKVDIKSFMKDLVTLAKEQI